MLILGKKNLGVQLYLDLPFFCKMMLLNSGKKTFVGYVVKLVTPLLTVKSLLV